MSAAEKPDTDRFSVSRGTLFVDKLMGRLIRVGGVGIIAAVFGIFIFIIAQVIPLFRGAEITPAASIPLAAPAGALVGLDERGELPFVATLSGEILFRRPGGGAVEGAVHVLPDGFSPAAFAYSGCAETLFYSDAAGTVVPVEIGYRVEHPKDASPRTIAEPKSGAPLALKAGPGVRDIRCEAGADSRLFVFRCEGPADAAVKAVRVKRKRGLGGKTREVVGAPEVLSAPGMGAATSVLVAGAADSVLVGDAKGEVYWFADDGDGFALRQRFKPFEGAPVALMGFIFGDMSVSFSDAHGKNTVWSLYQQVPESGKPSVRLWGHTKTLGDTPGAPTVFAASSNGKGYLLAGPGFASLRHSTTESVRDEIPLDFRVRQGGLGRHHDLMWFVDEAGDMRRFAVRDPHPEAGLKAFFGKIWYEGASEPRYSWQSTSGNDDFEPKLSLVPLLHGTLKGTLYAMLFAVPLSLLGAVYTSQFMRPEVRRVVKPVVELMASLPSVVLGFLAALWLAPRVEHAVPGILLAGVALPVAALLFGLGWSRLPARMRILVKPGYEFLALVPVALAVMVAAWACGPAFEHAVFGGDFPAWWRAHGGAFEQRNSLVVGFAMGFAVIPIVYTMAEDALANVPGSLVSASLALGASRWQTAWRVVVPTASAGIFSALMIGFGRAVGETMIVVMATGNTAVLDWNLFNGMRTASANIAVELPEAPPESTHYRTLFLCACCLFMLTFFVNTLAETLRHRLRERYKVV